MSTKLKVINPEIDKRWDEFVIRHPQGSIYHHSAWGNILRLTYKYIPFYVALERSETGEFEGIVPFMLVKSRLTGKRLISLPFAAYCNPLIPETEVENVVRFASYCQMLCMTLGSVPIFFYSINKFNSFDYLCQLL